MNTISHHHPLADRMRPNKITKYLGQNHILGKGKPLQMAIEQGKLHSMVFWGPPGTGKTTLAKLISLSCNAQFLNIPAVLSGIKEIRNSIEQAKKYREVYGRDTVLFVDEVHRFNKSQQDAFLPHVENGTIIFIGATTENPSFELNNALLSRVRVYTLKSLDIDSILIILKEAITNKEQGLGNYSDLNIDNSLLIKLANVSDGDARRALNLLEIASDLADGGNITDNLLDDVLRDGSLRRFDKGGDQFYEQISALHKSIRGSAPDAALYWFTCMIDGGCDPLYIARRVVRIASEDIGNADPRALHLALDAWDVQERLGSPEGELAIAQAIIYLSCAAKSNSVYVAYKKAIEDVKQLGTKEVPLHLRNSPTSFTKSIGYGKKYRYAHDEDNAYAAGENYFPEDMESRKYYHPVNRGLEIKIAEKLNYLREQDKK